MTLGIIGTAGRGTDADRLTKDTLILMFGVAQSFATLLRADRVVSGGAAWADSIAVSLYLRGVVPNLTLHLPASFHPFCEGSFGSGAFAETDAGRTANRYHNRATAVHGLDGPGEIREAIAKGAQVTTEEGSGMAPFFIRNAKVAADADAMLAFTYGVRGQPALKDGGTANTMATYLKRRGTIPIPDADMQVAFAACAWHYNLTDNRLYPL